MRAALSTQVIELEPIQVVVGSGYLQRTGFYRRTRTAIGYQLSRSQLDDMHPIVMSDVLMRVPGVRIIQNGRGAVPITTRLETALGQGDCRMRPYLDGMAMFEWNLDSLRPDDVEAIDKSVDHTNRRIPGNIILNRRWQKRRLTTISSLHITHEKWPHRCRCGHPT